MFASHRNANRAIRNSPHTEMKAKKSRGLPAGIVSQQTKMENGRIAS